MVTVTDVRRYLGNISSELLSDEQIQQAIDVATAEVNAKLPSDAPLRDNAILVLAAYHAYLSYATSLETVAGIVPAIVLSKLQLLKQEAERLLSYAATRPQLYVGESYLDTDTN